MEDRIFIVHNDMSLSKDVQKINEYLEEDDDLEIKQIKNAFKDIVFVVVGEKDY